MKIVILAGGGGTRLWPWSREDEPKQILPILGKDTLLQQTYKRLRLGFSSQDILIVTSRDYKDNILKQLPQLARTNLLLEPVRRDSAGAIGLAAARLWNKSPHEVLISVHADHYLSDAKEYVRTLKCAGRLAAQYPQQTILMGVKPAYPETGYGYIQVGTKFVQLNNRPVYRVRKFIEKPSVAHASRLIKNKNCFWNPGWFAWRVDHLRNLYKTYLPNNFLALEKISLASAKNLQATINREFIKLNPISIDYAILEKNKDMLVLPSTVGWADIGHWRSVQEMSVRDQSGNVVNQESLLVESSNNLILTKSRKFIAALGVKDLVFVETPDVILIADKNRAQDVKSIVAHLRTKKDWQRYL
ncbi:MAG: sugar phosphate nucleotidyltransferase [Candidatus Komeilibacteria bacterium]|nr:sugar phosphate nucleotidyltransferase [Candidatus Komeilibacteria bacterium]